MTSIKDQTSINRFYTNLSKAFIQNCFGAYIYIFLKLVGTFMKYEVIDK